MSMLDEFRKFALRGNAIDLAIGVVIGAAFGRIVDSIVGDLFMPLISALTGGLDFSNYFVPLSSRVTAPALAEAKTQGAVFAWGHFLTVVINFLVIAWILFLVVKAVNRVKILEDLKLGTAQRPELAADVKLLSEIRDILAAGAKGGGEPPGLSADAAKRP
jgi:large conductance mechanosensitive channel